MAEKFKAPRGTFDVLPEQAAQRERLLQAAREIFGLAGYRLIITPAFEDTALFERGVGKSTDIVRKEMFTFEDKGERSLTLRPEGTASVCRAYIEHGMHKLPQPVKLFYTGPFFRHERPQAGRYRQFNQIGAEAIGSDSPLVDVEVISLLSDLIEELGVPGVELRLGSLGSLDARATYLDELKSHLRSRDQELSEDVRARIEINPLRAFDSDHEGTRAVMADAPHLLDFLSEEDAEHFEQVKSYLGTASVPFTIDPTLVRGLDYYTRTIFSFVCDRLGAQSEIGGGGRYDGLIEQLGGPATPAIGWAAGIERILLALDEEVTSAGMDLFVVVPDPELITKAVALVSELRHHGLAVEMDLAGRSVKGQFKQADRVNAAHTLILEPGGTASLRNMETGDQRTVDPKAVANLIRS
ncbi:MAG TPA: histidine--tRNA ligase [Solirubrobacterales bacterium]|jgi:histidyl-tRNA synthetase|nr:histidine--tRNA ligase [Solirubrobacterales bacterium]HMU26928.1 histidine--tRNA ligase [Solirubrobacterales bacterium]HMX71733.1 histidine--tRNA ligase [Solirubrobacterales bacterium]HMY26459.1 histidine--tRNA ligase [Solirubrobacterales bacterium]HNA23930.1 histidine--tRNA ligase [Solirubrobacterales bacterium]